MKGACHGAVSRFVSRQSVGVGSASNSDPADLDFDLIDLHGPVERGDFTDGDSRCVSVSLHHEADGRAVLSARSNGADAYFSETDGMPSGSGFFHRLLPATDAGLLPDEETLSDLATSMRSAKRSRDRSTIPAAYTYLGQFLAHDLAYTSYGSDPRNPANLRTHAFDLDSLFDVSPVDHSDIGKEFRCRGGLCLGTTSSGRFADIPRDADGIPLLPDERNDNNVIVSQLVAAIIRFHHRICDNCGADEASARRATRQHMQSVILHDYLKRIVERDIYEEVMNHGRGFLFADSLPVPFRLPVEFSVGCFRFGHSMVRERYFLNRILSREPTRQILAHTHLGKVIDRDRPFLQDRWVIDWSFLLDLDEAREPEFAEAIDAKLPVHFSDLNRRWVNEMPADHASDTVPLSELTLKRGRSVGLPPAQDLVDCINAELARHSLAGSQPRKRVAGMADIGRQVSDTALQSVLSRDDRRIATATPLWFYTLVEAEHLGRDPVDGSTRLGPLASRIVMETVHAAIQASPDSILDPDQRIRFAPHPDLDVSQGNIFTLHDMFHTISNPH